MLEEKKDNILGKIGKFFYEFFDIIKGLDREGTIIGIKASNEIKGENAWLLIASIFIASLGLNLNSPAVIIGAMLISPLMGPILGIGLSMGINDGKLFLQALKNFGIAIIVSLIVSTVFFYITPIQEFTNEIFSRTKPTFLDALVAFFGGTAGIVSFSRKDSSNAIPGVAIATALMPPICVTGYGIANGDIEIVLNSFYLFFLNATLIALATFWIIKYLKFPLRNHKEDTGYKRVRVIISIITILILIPSGFILKSVLDDAQEERTINNFILENFGEEQHVINREMLEGDSTKTLVLDLLGTKIPKDSIINYQRKLDNLGLSNVSLSLIQDSDIELQEINKLKIEMQGQNKIYDQMQKEKEARELKEKEIADLKVQIDSSALPLQQFNDIKLEIKSLFDGIEELGCTQGTITDFEKDSENLIFLVKWNKKKPMSIRKKDEAKLLNFLKARMKNEGVKLIAYR